jgi:hypothetical protein
MLLLSAALASREVLQNKRYLEGRILLHIVASHNTPRPADRFKFLLGKGHDPMVEDGRG